MATYLVVKSAGQTKSYTCQSTHNGTPYLKVSNSYLDLTTKSHTGIRLKVVSNNVAYYPVVTRTVTVTETHTEKQSQTYYTSSKTTNAGISSTTALTRSSTYYTSSATKNAGISSTTALTRSSTYYTSSVTTNAGISSTTALTRESTYYTSSETTNAGISSTTGLTRSSTYYTSSATTNAGISSTTEITKTTGKKVRSITGTVNNLSLTTYGNWAPAATSIGKTTKSASELAQKYTRWTYTPSLTTASGSTKYYFNQLSSSFSEYITVANSYTYTSGVQRRWSDYYTSKDWVADSNIPAYMSYVGLRYTFDKLYVSRSSTSKTTRASLMTQTRRQWGETASSKSFSYLTYNTAYKTVASNAASNTNWLGSTYLTEIGGITGRSSRKSTSGITGRSSKKSTSGITGRSSRESTSGITGRSSRESTSGITGKSSEYITVTITETYTTTE